MGNVVRWLDEKWRRLAGLADNFLASGQFPPPIVWQQNEQTLTTSSVVFIRTMSIPSSTLSPADCGEDPPPPPPPPPKCRWEPPPPPDPNTTPT